MGYEPAPMRAFLGFVAGAIAVLVFHQGMWTLLHAAGLIAQVPYQTRPVWPFGVPAIASQCFWGGVYAATYKLVRPRLHAPCWLRGLCLGIAAALVTWFVLMPLKGMPAAYDWAPRALLLSLLLNLSWGLGVVMIMPLLRPRQMARA